MYEELKKRQKGCRLNGTQPLVTSLTFESHQLDGHLSQPELVIRGASQLQPTSESLSCLEDVIVEEHFHFGL